MNQDTTRILHLPLVIGGNSSTLAVAEKQLGYDSETLNVGSNPFQYPCDHSIQAKSLWQSMLNPFRKLAWMLSIPGNYSVVHYTYGSSLAPRRTIIEDTDGPATKLFKRVVNVFLAPFEHWDVRWAKFRGCKVYVTYQGDDARQRDYCRQHHEISHVDRVDPAYYSLHGDELKRQWIRDFDKLADRIFVVNPDLLGVLPKRAEFIGYASVDAQSFPYCPAPNEHPKILHAPSNRAAKGTDIVLSVLQELKEEGYEFELILVENIPNDVAKKIYENADILIDQLFAGWYGGLSTELMAMGKVVMAYLRESDFVYLPKEMVDDIPVINCRPADLKQQLSAVLKMSQKEREVLGQRMRHYVERWHNPIKLAQEVNCKKTP